MVKNLLLNQTTIFFKDGIIQTYWLMIIFGFYTISVQVYCPYRHPGMNIFDVISNLSLVLVAAIASWFAEDPPWLITAVASTML